MNKYLFQALTASEEESGHSGYEVTIYEECRKDAFNRAVEYFNDVCRVVTLVGSASILISESPDPLDNGAFHWSVVVNGIEQSNGVAFTQVAAEKAADDCLIFDVDL